MKTQNKKRASFTHKEKKEGFFTVNKRFIKFFACVFFVFLYRDNAGERVGCGTKAIAFHIRTGNFRPT